MVKISNSLYPYNPLDFFLKSEIMELAFYILNIVHNSQYMNRVHIYCEKF